MKNDIAAYYFHQGTSSSAYTYLGCNLIEGSTDGDYRYVFRTWAPNATSVGLVSDFSGWGEPIPFEKITDAGVWELKYVSKFSLHKMPYKFRIASENGVYDKAKRRYQSYTWRDISRL